MRGWVQAGLQPDTAIYNGILRLLSDQGGSSGGPRAMEAIVAEMEASSAVLSPPRALLVFEIAMVCYCNDCPQ